MKVRKRHRHIPLDRNPHSKNAKALSTETAEDNWYPSFNPYSDSYPSPRPYDFQKGERLLLLVDHAILVGKRKTKVLLQGTTVIATGEATYDGHVCLLFPKGPKVDLRAKCLRSLDKEG